MTDADDADDDDDDDDDDDRNLNVVLHSEYFAAVSTLKGGQS